MTNAANEMAVFERVIERGSFASAARDVGLSASAVSKLISRLEHRLGVRLINRTTRRLALTTEGATYLKRSREILAAIEAAESEIASDRTSPRGHLRVHAPPSSRRMWISPCGRGRSPTLPLIARKIIDLTQIVCASPGYLAHHGRPVVPTDLARHPCLTLSSIPKPATWLFNGDGGPFAVEVSGPVSADSSDVLVRLAVEGVGIVRLGEFAVARAIITGTLQPLLQDVQVQEGYPLWALMPPGRQRSPKVKVFLEFLAERLGRAPWRASLGIAKKR